MDRSNSYNCTFQSLGEINCRARGLPQCFKQQPMKIRVLFDPGIDRAAGRNRPRPPVARWLFLACSLRPFLAEREACSHPPCPFKVTKLNPALAQGFVPDDDANASFTARESFDQPQASELSSQGADFDRSADFFAVGEGGFLGVNTSGGPTG